MNDWRRISFVRWRAKEETPAARVGVEHAQNGTDFLEGNLILKKKISIQRTLIEKGHFSEFRSRKYWHKFAKIYKRGRLIAG